MTSEKDWTWSEYDASTDEVRRRRYQLGKTLEYAIAYGATDETIVKLVRENYPVEPPPQDRECGVCAEQPDEDSHA